MKLERITLENFRQYCGRQKLNFSKDPQRNVTVIHGVNGAGKTSLFMAINWCLYGEGVPAVEKLVSKEAVNQAREGEVIRTLVELSFSHDGERYLASRRLEGVRQRDGSVSLRNEDGFTMTRTRYDGGAERVNNPFGTMNAVLPSNVRTYFLFDGEKIDNFAKPEASDEVRYAIYNVLKLEVLTRGRRHLEDAAAEYRRELKSISKGELRDLIEREEEARNRRERESTRREELEREIDAAHRNIAEIDQRLRETQNARELQQRRDRLDHDLKQRRAEMENLIIGIRDLATSGYMIAAQPAVDYALAVLNKKREKGEIPSNVRRQFVDDLIEQRRCICGRHFDLGSREHDQLLELMKGSLPSALEDDILDTSATLRSFGGRTSSLRDDLDTNMRRHTALREIVKGLDEELDDVRQQLKGSPQEEISRLENKRQAFESDIDSYRAEKFRLDMSVEDLSKEIERLERQIHQAKKDEHRERLLNRKAMLAQRSADAIDEIYQSFADDMRRRIEAKTEEIFKLLIWKDSYFQDIRLDPDYSLEVIDRYGLPARPDLSAGERQVLSLSFITAMSRVSEEEAPLVMDTPFGRLSSHHRDSITKRLPELADQLVLFVTDEELRDQARRNLESRIGAEYRLEFDLATGCTEIEEVLR
jgi:DNA sulfur modification protein DndD